MRLDPVTVAEVEDDKVVSLIDREHTPAHPDFPTRDSTPLFFIFELRGAVFYRLQFFGKKTFLALGAVELLAGVIELCLQFDGRWCTGIDRGRLLFFDFLL